MVTLCTAQRLKNWELVPKPTCPSETYCHCAESKKLKPLFRGPVLLKKSEPFLRGEWINTHTCTTDVWSFEWNLSRYKTSSYFLIAIAKYYLIYEKTHLKYKICSKPRKTVTSWTWKLLVFAFDGWDCMTIILKFLFINVSYYRTQWIETQKIVSVETPPILLWLLELTTL